MARRWKPLAGDIVGLLDHGHMLGMVRGLPGHRYHASISVKDVDAGTWREEEQAKSAVEYGVGVVDTQPAISQQELQARLAAYVGAYLEGRV